MNEKLKGLIAQANHDVDADKAARDAEARRRDTKQLEEDAKKFQHHVESALGREALEAIGPVTFNKNFLENSMAFEQEGQAFRLQQVTGS